MLNFYIDHNTFLMDLGSLILVLFIRKTILLIKLIIDPLVFYLFCKKLWNTAYLIQFMNILILYYQKFNVASEKVSGRNIH